MDEQTGEIIKEVSKEIAKDVYDDAGKPVLEPTGQTVGLIPRAIKAALLPIEKWVLGREYNLKETQKLLEEKLKNVRPEDIEPPEAYIAVPALQNISYCMDSKELRNMYANLLANSMNKVVKNKVHPGFVEIVKQLTPDEAKIIRGIYLRKVIPIITVRYENDMGEGIDIFKDFSDIAEKTNCEETLEVGKYFDNLIRLGLLAKAEAHSSLVDKKLYEPLKENQNIKKLEEIPQSYQNQGYTKCKFKESYFEMTPYGNAFCEICVVEKMQLFVEIK